MKTLIWFASAALLFASSAFGSPITYVANLSGPNESPANASPGIGTATITMDVAAHTMLVDAVFSGLVGGVTAAHIHCCITIPGGTAGVATTTPTFTGFPSGVTSGSYSNLLDMTLSSSYNPAFVAAHSDIAGAEAFLAAGMAAGNAYFNIHSSSFPGGEIRGFLVEAAVPEPGTLVLAGLALAGICVARRARRAL